VLRVSDVKFVRIAVSHGGDGGGGEKVCLDPEP